MTVDEISLKDAVEFVVDNRGKTVPIQQNGIPLIATNCINNNSLYPEFINVRYVSEEIYKNWFRAHPQPDDIILTNKGSQNGAICLVPNPVNFCIAQDMVALRAKKGIIYPRYLFAALRSKLVQNRIKELNVDSVIPHFKKTDFDKLLLPKLSYNHQILIGDLYFNFCQKIHLNTQTNQTLESIAQAIFKSWFVDFEPVKAKMAVLAEGGTREQAELAAMSAISGKNEIELAQMQKENFEHYSQLAETAALFPSAMMESELGEIPEGWAVSTLGEYLTIKRGGSPRPIQDFMADTGLPWVKIADATAESSPFLFSTKEFIKEAGLSKTVLLKKGSLILTNSATPGLPKFLELDACIHDGWLYFPEKNLFSDEYLYFLFLKIRTELVAQGNGSVFTNLKTDILKAQRAITPNAQIMESFSKTLKSILENIKSNSKQIRSLSEIRDSLLPKLLSGEIDLSESALTLALSQGERELESANG